MSFLLLVALCWTSAVAFSSMTSPGRSHSLVNQKLIRNSCYSHLRQIPTRLASSPEGTSSFDIAKPIFDLYAFRTVRGDALAKYNSLNQSEPLRINLSLLVALSFLASPFLASDLYGQSLTLPQTALVIGASVASLAIFRRECQRRNNQLTRLEKELDALDLSIRLPANSLADNPYLQSRTLKQTLASKASSEGGMRLIAINGPKEELKAALSSLRILGRRLVQANTYVLVIPSDSSTIQDWGLDDTRQPWLASTDVLDSWRQYCTVLSDNQSPESATTFKWFGISATGRSFGSGQGSIPSWLQLMGQFCRPVEVLDPDYLASQQTKEAQAPLIEQAIKARHSDFYKALTTGDYDGIQDVFKSGPGSESELVSQVVADGGRLDGWKFCLQDGNRPEGMTIADVDVTILSETMATSTNLEFPETPGGRIDDATLLAIQEWEKVPDENGVWKLKQHQTIPWSTSQPAAGTLICDGRGCVSLMRTSR